MDKIIIENIEPYDGTYELDVTGLTARELNRIKQMSGVRAAEIPDAITTGDVAVTVAIAAIALERRGKYVDEDLLWDGWSIGDTAGTITLDLFDRREDDADPPALKSDGESSSAADVKSASSGDSGSNGSESQEKVLPPTGQGRSVRSVGSAPGTSAT